MCMEIIVKPDFINFLMGRYADTIVTVSNAVPTRQAATCERRQVIYNSVDNAVYQVMDASAVRDQFASHRMPWLLEWLVE